MPRLITVSELLTAPADGPSGNALQARAQHSVTLGPLSVTFESRPTVLATLLAIVSTEGVSDPDALQAECDVYNALLPPAGLSAEVCVQGTTPHAARTHLTSLANLEQHLWLVVGNVPHAAQFLAPLSVRQHVVFALDAATLRALSDADTPVLLRTDHPNHRHDVALSGALRRALVEDLLCDS